MRKHGIHTLPFSHHHIGRHIFGFFSNHRTSKPKGCVFVVDVEGTLGGFPRFLRLEIMAWMRVIEGVYYVRLGLGTFFFMISVRRFWNLATCGQFSKLNARERKSSWCL